MEDSQEKVSENLRVRQIYERSLKSEPSIVKLIENQSEHLAKLTLYHLKKRATRRSRRAREEICLQKDLTIEIPKSSKLHARYIVLQLCESYDQ